MDIKLSGWIMSRILVLMALYSSLTRSILCSCNDVVCQGRILSLSFDTIHLAKSSFGVFFKSVAPLHNTELISASLTQRTMSLHSNDCYGNKQCLVKRRGGKLVRECCGVYTTSQNSEGLLLYYIIQRRTHRACNRKNLQSGVLGLRALVNQLCSVAQNTHSQGRHSSDG